MMLTALSISSMDNSTPTALLRDSAPNIPMANRIADSTRKCCRPIGASAMALLLPSDDDCADQSDGQQHRRDPERQDVGRQEQGTDGGGRLLVERGAAQQPRLTEDRPDRERAHGNRNKGGADPLGLSRAARQINLIRRQ